MRISGLAGMYAFCAAVLLSLITGVAIDTLDDAQFTVPAGHQRGLSDAQPSGEEGQQNGLFYSGPSTPSGRGVDGLTSLGRLNLNSEVTNLGPEIGASSSMSAALMASPKLEPRQRLAPLSPALLLHSTLVVTQLALACVTLGAPIFRRHVLGGVPDALRERGISFDGDFSILEVTKLATGGGGLDYFMAGTFAVFLLLGPLCRPLSFTR